MCAAFVAVDYVLLKPDRIGDDFVICLFCRLVVIAACWWYTVWTTQIINHEHAEHHKNDSDGLACRALVGLVILQLIAFFTSVIAVQIGGAQSNYFAGVIMVFVGIAVMIPIRPVVLAWKMLLMILVYALLVDIDEGQVIPSIAALTNIALMIGGAAVAWYGCRALDKYRLIQENEIQSSNATPSAVGELDGVRDDAEIPIKTKNAFDIFRVALTILIPVVGAAAKSLTSDKYIPGDSSTIEGKSLTFVGGNAATVDFRNTTGFTINLSNAQIFFKIDGNRYIIKDIKNNGTREIVRAGDAVIVALNKKVEGYFIELNANEKEEIKGARARDYHLIGVNIDPSEPRSIAPPRQREE